MRGLLNEIFAVVNFAFEAWTHEISEIKSTAKMSMYTVSQGGGGGGGYDKHSAHFAGYSTITACASGWFSYIDTATCVKMYNNRTVIIIYITHLYLSRDSSGVHSAGDVHRVTPDVVLRLVMSNHSRYHRAVIEA